MHFLKQLYYTWFLFRIGLSILLKSFLLLVQINCCIYSLGFDSVCRHWHKNFNFKMFKILTYLEAKDDIWKIGNKSCVIVVYIAYRVKSVGLIYHWNFARKNPDEYIWFQSLAREKKYTFPFMPKTACS